MSYTREKGDTKLNREQMSTALETADWGNGVASSYEFCSEMKLNERAKSFLINSILVFALHIETSIIIVFIFFLVIIIWDKFNMCVENVFKTSAG